MNGLLVKKTIVLDQGLWDDFVKKQKKSGLFQKDAFAQALKAWKPEQAKKEPVAKPKKSAVKR